MFLGIATCCMCQPFWLDVPSSKTGWFYRLKCHTGQWMEVANKEFALSQWFLTESAECQQAITYRETTQSAFMDATPSWTTVFLILKFRQPKQNLSLRTPLTTSACWADVSVGQASKKFKPRNSMCAKFFKPRDKGSVQQNLRKGRGPETNGISLSPLPTARCSQSQRAFQDRYESKWHCLEPLGLSLCSS